MSRLLNHVEDEFQAFLKLLCPCAIMFRSKVPKESIIIKDELFSKMKKESLTYICLTKGRRKPKSYKTN
jgi:hypothetical protein